MVRTLTQRREAIKVWDHSVMGILHTLGRWHEIPHLKDNDGMLPPNLIVCGSRNRVWGAIDTLSLRDAVLIDEAGGRLVGKKALGRVALAVGIFDREGLPVPIAIGEHGMGCPSAEILVKEYLFYARSDGYRVGSTFVKSDGVIRVVRDGTAGGINGAESEAPIIGIGDIAIATDNYGSIGAIVQSVFGLLDFVGVPIKGRVEALAGRLVNLIGLSKDNKHFHTTCSPELVAALCATATRLGIEVKKGPNFTKDSLYVELAESIFILLRRKYGMISTEMEQLVIDTIAGEFTCAGIPVQSALVSAIIGAVPGTSFPRTSDEWAAAHGAEERSLVLVANTLADITVQTNKSA